jgi:hypothetical protein
MWDHLQTLIDLNHAINATEDAGDVATMDQCLAEALAFRRFDGKVVNRADFLKGVKPSGPRSIEVRSVDLVGQARALVRCVVTMPVEGRERTFDNLRLFQRGDDGAGV